jgi:hypothetical protein
MPDDIFQYMYDDPCAPRIPKIPLQKFDNYQIYSLILCDYPFKKIGIDKTMTSYASGDNGISFDGSFFYSTGKSFNNPDPIDYFRPNPAIKVIAYQRFSPDRVTVNFDEIANKLNIKPHNYRVYRYVSASNIIKSTSDTFANAPSPPNIILEYYDLASDTNELDPNQYSHVRRDHYTAPRNNNPRTSSNTYTLLQDIYTTVGALPPAQLDMYAVINGYSEDPRTKPSNFPEITPSEDGELLISYYRQNTLEKIPNLTSLDWYSHSIKLTKGEPIRLLIINPVFGTLNIKGDSQLVDDVKTQLLGTEVGRYKWSDFYVENIDTLVNHWKQIYNNYTIQPAPSPSLGSFYNILIEHQQPFIRLLSANNNYWDNDDTNYPDIQVPNTDPNMGFIGALPPVLSVSKQQAYNWHIKPQPDGSIGDLEMDGIRTIEMHRAFNCGKWGINPDDSTKPRKDDLGWRIQRINEVLGIRVGTDGKFDPDKEKKIVRQVIPAKQKLDAEKIGVNCFGVDGMVVKRINNRFNGDKIESDQCVIVQDVLQLIQEYHEQHNLAVGLQESSAIEIKDGKDKEGKSKARFDNQLGLLVEMFNLLSSANEMTRSALISSLVTQSQTNELIAGLGLPSVTKTIPIEIDKKVTQLPYKGIAPHRSISQEVATCTANVGIVLGQLI